MKNKTTKQQNGSIILGLVFGIGMLGLGIVATTMVLSTSNITNNSIAASGVRMLVTADAANREGIRRVLEDFDTNGTVTFTNEQLPLLNASNQVEVDVTGTWPIYEVRGISKNILTTRKVVADIDLFPSGEAFDKAIYTDGELNISGSSLAEGAVYATKGIEFTGNKAEVDGNAQSPESVTTNQPSIEDNLSAGSKAIENYPVIAPPTISSDTYESGAVETDDPQSIIDATSTDHITIHADNPPPPPNSTLSINGGFFNGMIIAEQKLKISGSASTSADLAISPIVIYAKNGLEISGNAQINGVIYVLNGDVTISGANGPGDSGVKINGSIVCVDSSSEIKLSGNATVTWDETYASAWKELFDDGVLTGAPPAVSEWHEE